MIVQCDKCKTKFRIADDKVAANGVKVRCSRCAHVFMVQRDPTLQPPASHDVLPTVATAIPTALFGQQSNTAPTPPQQSALPSFPERPRSNNSNTPISMVAPTDLYPVPSLVPAAATTKDAMIALGFAAAPDPNEPSKNRDFDEESTATFTAASLLPPEKKARHAFDDDANQRFPAPPSESTPEADPEQMPGIINTFDELFGKEPPTHVGNRPAFETVTTPSNPSMPAMEALRASERMETIRSSPGLNAVKSNPAMQSPLSSGPKSNPMMQSPLSSGPKSNPSMQSPMHGARLGEVEPPSPRVDRGSPKSNPALAALAAAEVGTPADPMTSPFFPPPTGIPGLGTTTNLQAILSLQNGEKNGHGGLSSSDLGDIPGLMPPATDDPFAGLDLDGSHYSGGDLGGEDSLAETRAVPEGLNPSKALAKIDLARSAGVPTHFESNMATTRVATALLTDGDESADLAASMESMRRWPTYVGLALGLAVTIAALFGPAGGELSRLGPEDIVALVKPPVSEPIDTSVGEIEPKNAQVTLYPGKNGKMLLVVAGEAYNDGDAPIAGVEAVASVRNGNEVLEQREGWVGLTLEEDALSAIGSPAELEVAIADAMRAANVPLDKRSIAPGESVPFMIVFPDPPAELERRAFHVDFRRGTITSSR